MSLSGICPTMWYLIYAAASINTGKQQVDLTKTTELNRIFNKHMLATMDPCTQEYATKIVLHIFSLMTQKHFSESYRSQGTTLHSR